VRAVVIILKSALLADLINLLIKWTSRLLNQDFAPKIKIIKSNCVWGG